VRLRSHGADNLANGTMDRPIPTSRFLTPAMSARIDPIPENSLHLSRFLNHTGCATFVVAAVLATAQSTTPPPAHLTSEQDHQRIMEQLHITELRRGPDGDPKSPNAANFDEAKVSPYLLFDPLMRRNRKRILTAEAWWEVGRPEIVEDFDREIYGRVPPVTPKVVWEVVSTTKETVGDFPVITKKLLGHVDNSSYPQVIVDIQLSLTTPASATTPVPVMMEFGLAPEALVSIRKRFTDAQWAAMQGNAVPWQQLVLAKGWGYAVLIPTSVQADNGEGLTQGIIGLVNKGQPRKLDDWGTLRAWAWGASRALDYFETDKSVDAKQVGIEGLSLRQSRACRHGLRLALRHRIHRLFGCRRSENSSPQIRRAGRKSGFHLRIPLVRRQLPQICRTVRAQ
jgi:hypothetical protein